MIYLEELNKKLNLIHKTANELTTRTPTYRLVIEIARSKETLKNYTQDLDECDALEIDPQCVKDAFPLLTDFFETLDILKSTKGQSSLVKKQLEKTVERLFYDQKNTTLNIDTKLINEIKMAADEITPLKNLGSKLKRPEVNAYNYYESNILKNRPGTSP